MRSDRKWAVSLAMAGLLFLSAGAATASDLPLKSSSVNLPASEMPTLTDVTGYVMSFMPVTPCRIIDTRGGAPFTGGAFVAGASRDYQFSAAAAPCNGIPAGARGVSINVAVTSTAGAGFLSIYPRNGQPVPLVASINYAAGQTIANAAAVPTDGSGFITILCGAAGTHVIVDINGYYIGSGGGTDMNPGVYAGFSGDVGAGLLFAQNKNTTSATNYTSAVRGYMTTTQNGPSAVLGEAHGATGSNYGVRGSNDSTSLNSAGVYGLSGVAPAPSGSYHKAGVRGDASGTAYGVLGLSESTGSLGGLIDSGTGGFLRGGRLGYSTYGVYSQGDMGGTGAKYFVEPHPEDPARVIKYVALEGPEAGTYFRGRGRFVDGSARITVPDSFRFVTDTEGITVQVTPIGRPAAVAVVSADLQEIVVEATKDVEFSYLVQGFRRAFKNFDAIVEGTEFAPESPDGTIPAYLTQEARQRLVANGTYNPDGTVNMKTAERIGWAQAWRDHAEAARRAAEAAVEAAKSDPQISGRRPPVSGRP